MLSFFSCTKKIGFLVFLKKRTIQCFEFSKNVLSKSSGVFWVKGLQNKYCSITNLNGSKWQNPKCGQKRKMQRDLDRLPMHALKKLHSTDKQDWLTMKTLKNGCWWSTISSKKVHPALWTKKERWKKVVNTWYDPIFWDFFPCFLVQTFLTCIWMKYTFCNSFFLPMVSKNHGWLGLCKCSMKRLYFPGKMWRKMCGNARQTFIFHF